MTRIVAYRSVAALASLRESLEDWYAFYNGYDPSFGWWVRASHDRLCEGLDGYVKFLREKVVGIEPGKDEPIVGDPIGRAGIEAELAHEMIAYSPEELLAIANREFAWCDAEWKRAAREMGYGDDWWKRGNMSFYFRQATVDRESVRAFARPGEPHARLWMENEAGALIAEGTASCAGSDTDTAVQRLMQVVRSRRSMSSNT